MPEEPSVPTVEMAWVMFKSKTIHMAKQMIAVFEPLQDPIAALGKYGVESANEHHTLNDWVKKLKRILVILDDE